MGQEEILKFLKAHPKGWFNVNDLKIGINAKSQLHKSLSSLRRFKMVDFEYRKVPKSIKFIYFYRWKK